MLEFSRRETLHIFSWWERKFFTAFDD